MFSPSVAVGVEEVVFGQPALGGGDDEGKEDEGGEEGVEQQHRDDGIGSEGLLLEHIVETQQTGGHEGEKQPHHSCILY